MIIYINKYKIKPGTTEAMLEELNASGAEKLFRKQPGNVIFNFSIPAEEEDVLYLTDVWEDQASCDAHLTCEAMPLWHAVKDKYVIDKEIRHFEGELV